MRGQPKEGGYVRIIKMLYVTKPDIIRVNVRGHPHLGCKILDKGTIQFFRNLDTPG